MKLAERVLGIKPSATLTISAKAQALKSEGKSIISLSVGEPDFPTPKHICEAAKQAIDEGKTKYTPVPGTSELRKAVADFFHRCGAPSAKAENIIVSNGGKHSLYNMCQTILNPGDQAIIIAPYWVSYPPMVELAEGKPTIIQTTAEKGYKVSVAELNRHLTPKTRILILNSPSNPTGACYTKAEIDAIAQWAVDKDIIVFSDEIYAQLTYEGSDLVSLAPWWEKHPDNFIITNGASKTYSMTGWRIGYSLASAECIKAMSRIQGQSTSNASSISQAATLAALTGGDEAIKAMLAEFEKRRNLALSIIKTWPNVTVFKPQGAFYLFVDMHAHYNDQYPDSTTLCSYLLDKAGVAAVPGIAFGDDNCIRFSFATSEELISEALEKIKNVLF